MLRTTHLVLGTGAFLLLVAAVGGTVGRRGGGNETTPATVLMTAASEMKGSTTKMDECSMEPTMALAVIALESGNGSPSGQISGRDTKPLLAGLDGSQPAPGSGALVVITAPSDVIAAGQVANEVRTSGAVGKAGVVLTHSNDPALRSCDYDLADSPTAAALATVAGKAMVAGGFVKPEALSAAGRTWSVTDDPLDSSLVIVTLGVDGKPDVRPALGAPTRIFTRQGISALVNRQDGSVVAVGYSPW